MGIVSMNYEAVIRTALERIGGLGEFFDAESIVGRDSVLMRRCEHNKGRVIATLMRRSGIGYEQALFVDDTAKNIKSAHGVCLTLRVSALTALSEADMRTIEQCVDRSKGEHIELIEDAKETEFGSPKRTRSRFEFTRSASSCDVTDIMSSFCAMSVTPNDRIRKRTRLERDETDDEESKKGDDVGGAEMEEEDDDEPGGFLSSMW